MLKIQLTKSDWLVGSEKCWALAEMKTRKRDGTDVVEPNEYAWFTTPAAAVRSVFDKEIRHSDAKSFTEAYEEAKNVLARLSEALRPHFELVEQSEREAA